MTRSRLAVILGPMRLPFLTLPPLCVLLGAAAAARDGAAVTAGPVLLALLGALAAHVAVNALNEYDDFRSRLDEITTRTPFSGGSGTLPAHPEAAPLALGIGLAAVAVTVAVGIHFLRRAGWGIVPLGLAGLLLVVLYTRWLTRSVVLCLLAPGLGFGPLMVVGTAYVLGGRYGPTAWVASLVPLFLVSGLLLLNQLPDAEADARVGRRHLVVAHGRRVAVRVYGLLLLLTYVSVVGGWLAGVLPAWSLLVLLTLPLALATWRGAAAHAADIPALVPYLGRNVALVHAATLLLAVGLWVG